MQLTYQTDARAYLARARQCLIESEHRFLFYAAFELRCCIETRQAGYIAALEFYRGNKVKPWRLRELSGKLRKVWDRPSIASIRFYFDDGWSFQTYYTPVTKELVMAAEKELGQLLHSVYIDQDEWPAWADERKRALTRIYRDAWLACQGQHLAPPIWDADTREPHPFCIEGGDEVRELFERFELGATGKTQFRFELDYLNHPPKNWHCDL